MTLAFLSAAALGLAACGGSTDEPAGSEPAASPAAGTAATTPATQPAGGDALVEGTSFHATGNLRCSMKDGEEPGLCPFGVTREGRGNGMVTITKPDGRTRVVFFEKGTAIGADVSQADPGEFSASREGDATIVRIGPERYEIPDAVIMGG
jgi:hypothetical protein